MQLLLADTVFATTGRRQRYLVSGAPDVTLILRVCVFVCVRARVVVCELVG